MYNGIGLQTARGSGTSGYVQKNLSFNVKKPHTREQFLRELQEKRKNNVQPSRKANPQIIQHERKRQILLRTMKYKKELIADGVSEEEINDHIKRFQKQLKEKFAKGEIQTQNKDSHVMTEAKQKEFAKVQKAFGLQGKFKPGSAFDFEAQRVERLKKMQEKRKRASIKCPHNECQKRFDSQELLDRHLKYKHPNSQKRIKKEQQNSDEQYE